MADDRPQVDVSRVIEDYRTREAGLSAVLDAVTAADRDQRRAAVQAVAAACEKTPERFVRDAVVRELDRRLRDEDAETRSEAALALARIAEQDPEAVRPVADRLRETFSVDEYGRAQTHAFLALERLTRQYPDVAPPVLGTVVERLESHSILDRDCAVETLSKVASHDRDLLSAGDADVVSSLAALLRSKPASVHERGRRRNPMTLERANRERIQEEEIREKAAALIGDLLRDSEYGFDVNVAVEALADVVDDDNDVLAAKAANGLATIAERRPETVQSVAPALLEGFAGADRQQPRSACLSALTTLAETDTEGFAVVASTDRLFDLLDADSPGVRAGAVGLLGFVAEAGDKSLDQRVDAITSLATDEAAVVRANAAMTLGSLEGDEARETLEQLAESSGEDPLVREAAAEALELR